MEVLHLPRPERGPEGHAVDDPHCFDELSMNHKQRECLGVGSELGRAEASDVNF